MAWKIIKICCCIIILVYFFLRWKKGNSKSFITVLTSDIAAGKYEAVVFDGELGRSKTKELLKQLPETKNENIQFYFILDLKKVECEDPSGKGAGKDCHFFVGYLLKGTEEVVGTIAHCDSLNSLMKLGFVSGPCYTFDEDEI